MRCAWRTSSSLRFAPKSPDGLEGYNTDVIGIRKSLEGVTLEGAKALVLGTGGASKAVQYVLRTSGAEVKVVSRTEGVADLTYNDLSEECIAEYDIIVNTTPLGMFPNVDSAPELPYSAISSKHTLFDCVYNPRQTKFLQLGAEQGARTIDGLTMFHAQAEASWEIWQTENGKLTQRSECRGQTCLHYAEPQGRKDCEAGLTRNGKTDNLEFF